jgi:hypothetical protein
MVNHCAGEYATDEDGDKPDWIELYNAGNSLVDLSGYYTSGETISYITGSVL